MEEYLEARSLGFETRPVLLTGAGACVSGSSYEQWSYLAATTSFTNENLNSAENSGRIGSLDSGRGTGFAHHQLRVRWIGETGKQSVEAGNVSF